MPGRLPAGLLLAAAAGALLTSCSLRLPIDDGPPPTVRRQLVAKQPPPAEPAPDREPLVLVWLIANKYHTGLVFPYDWLVESGFVPPEGFDSPKSVVMSWGNRDAYSEAGLDSTGKIVRVLLTPTPSVMELIVADWDVAEMIPHQRIWKKQVPREMGKPLAHFLNECSRDTPNGTPVVVCPASWGDGVQIECKYRYFIPRVCNVWTAQAMEAIGCDMNPWWALTAAGVARQAERNGFELIWNAYGNQQPDTRDTP